MGPTWPNPARCSELLHLAQSLELHATRGIINMAEQEPNNWDETSSRIDEARELRGNWDYNNQELGIRTSEQKVAYCDHVLGP